MDEPASRGRGGFALGALVRELAVTGAVAVETPFRDDPHRIAARTSIHLVGGLVLQIDPGVRVSSREWEDHQSAVAESIAPLQWWLRVLGLSELLGRWVPAPAAMATLAGGVQLHEHADRLGWALLGSGVPLLVLSLSLRYALRPLLAWLLRWVVDRAGHAFFRA